jgi:hypothetical protein
MSNICKAFSYQGLAACQAMLGKVKGLLITTSGATATKANLINLTANRVIVSSASGMTGMLLDISRGYERTSADPEINTSNLGLAEKTMNSLPSLRGFLNVSMCDYKTMIDLDGLEFDVRLLTNNNLWMVTEQSAGTVKGFRAKLVVRWDLPVSDNGQTNYPIDVYFTDSSEWETPYYAGSSFSFTELMDYVPAGIDISLGTAYTGGDVILDSRERCTLTAYNGFDAVADWESIESNAAGITISAVSTALGLNTITIKKNTTVNLAASDWVRIQGKLTDGTYWTHVSNVFKFWGGT